MGDTRKVDKMGRGRLPKRGVVVKKKRGRKFLKGKIIKNVKNVCTIISTKI